MILKKKADFLLFLAFLTLFFLPAYCEEKVFPLDLEVAFPAVFCDGKVYLFSKTGRNQTLNPGDDAPYCNITPLYPVAVPVCFEKKLYLADSSGAVFEMSQGFPKQFFQFNEKVLGFFNIVGKLCVLTENKLVFLGGEEFSAPFKVLEGFQSKDTVLLFGENKGAIFSGGKISFQFDFSKGKVTSALVVKDKIIAGTENALFFMNGKNGKIKRTFASKSEVVVLLAVDEDKIAAATKDHIIRLFDLKGNVIWQKRTGGRPLGLWKGEKGLFTAAEGGKKVDLIDTKKGNTVWSYTLKEGETIIPPSFCETKMALFSFDSKPEPTLFLVEIPR